LSDQASTPCIKLCKIDPASGLCAGCRRTLVEIQTWGFMSEAERRAVMRDLPSRSIETAKNGPELQILP
jgi:hypothetical protein